MSGLIKIVKYQGKNGGFAKEESTLYRVDVIGINSSVRYGQHYTEIKYAIQEAESWAKFTGWPIKRFKVTKVVKEIETEVGVFGEGCE